MPFSLPDLPFALDALEPDMSKQTLEFHWGASFTRVVGSDVRVYGGF
jgi:superoxide dismutase